MRLLTLCFSAKADDFIESIIHYVEKALVDFALPPEEALAVLDPFEIADGDAARIAENVRHGKNAFRIDNGVGLPSGGTVGAFAKDFCLDLIGVFSQ